MIDYLWTIFIPIGIVALILFIGFGFWWFIQSACKNAIEEFFDELLEEEN